MMIFFVLILIVLILAVQRRVVQNSLNDIKENYWPEEKVVNPEERTDIILSISNFGKKDLSFVKTEIYFPRQIQVETQELKVTRDIELGGRKIAHTASIRRRSELRFRIPVSFPDRGRYVLPHPILFGGDFLGITETRREFSQYREVVVAPPECRISELTRILGSFLGDYSVRRFLFEDPILTIGYHEYTGCEPMRQIDWKQSAKSGCWMVKEYDHTVEAAVAVLLNMDSPEGEEEKELSFSIARSVCSVLEKSRIKYEFCTNAEQAGKIQTAGSVGDGLGQYHFLRVLECLGRGMSTVRMSCDCLLKQIFAENENERGLIVITPGKELEESQVFLHYRAVLGQNILVLCAKQFL